MCILVKSNRPGETEDGQQLEGRPTANTATKQMRSTDGPIIHNGNRAGLWHRWAVGAGERYCVT
jgi:hypothetical protein